MTNEEDEGKAQGAKAEEEGEEYPPLLDYLQSKEGHELASRIVAILEGIKKDTIESTSEQHKRDSEHAHKIQRLWLSLQAGVFTLTIIVAAVLAWQGKLDATVAALMGTLFGYFLGRPLR